MKNTLKNIVETKLFEAMLAFVIFLIIILGLNMAIGVEIGPMSILADLVISLLVAGVVYIGAGNNKLHHKIIKRRSEHLEVAGLLAVGFLLFVVFLVVYITT
jgi:hypothetical protein